MPLIVACCPANFNCTFYDEEPITSDIHMPRIGCGLASGDWDDIEPIIQDTLCSRGADVYVYDLDPPKERE